MSLINQTVINCPTLHHSHQFSLSLFLLFFFLLCALHLQVHSHFTRIFLFCNSYFFLDSLTFQVVQILFYFFLNFACKNSLKIYFYWVFPVCFAFFCCLFYSFLSIAFCLIYDKRKRKMTMWNIKAFEKDEILTKERLGKN